MRGYFGIGIAAGKSPENVGGLWRSGHALGASFLFTVGARYPKRLPMDTTDAAKHVPLYAYEGAAHFLGAGVPADAELVGVEITPDARSLVTFEHPERALYVLGAEDRGLPLDILTRCRRVIAIPSTYCLNVATAGSIVMYDRLAKGAK